MASSPSEADTGQLTTVTGGLDAVKGCVAVHLCVDQDLLPKESLLAEVYGNAGRLMSYTILGHKALAGPKDVYGAVYVVVTVNVVVAYQEPLSIIIALYGRQFGESAGRNNLLVNRLIFRKPFLEMCRAA